MVISRAASGNPRRPGTRSPQETPDSLFRYCLATGRILMVIKFKRDGARDPFVGITPARAQVLGTIKSAVNRFGERRFKEFQSGAFSPVFCSI